MLFVYTTNLSEVRTFAERQARMAGLPDDRVVDFMIAVSEVAGNTVRHAKSAGSLEIWSDADEIVCEIRDAGVITDPLAGASPPPPDASGGHGLWLVHQICDRVNLRSDSGGTVIRMHMLLRQTPRRALNRLPVPPWLAGCSLGANEGLLVADAKETGSWTLAVPARA